MCLGKVSLEGEGGEKVCLLVAASFELCCPARDGVGVGGEGG